MLPHESVELNITLKLMPRYTSWPDWAAASTRPNGPSGKHQHYTDQPNRPLGQAKATACQVGLCTATLTNYQCSREILHHCTMNWPPITWLTALKPLKVAHVWMNEWKCTDLRCDRKPTSLIHHANKKQIQPLSRVKLLDGLRVHGISPVGKEVSKTYWC